MIGILAEKTSAARNFAKALGGMQGNYNGEDYIIVAARGHLYGFINDPAKQVPVYSKHTRTSSTDKKNMISASTNKEHYPLPCRLKAVFRYRVFFHIYTAIHITARCFQHIHGFLLSPVYKKLQFRISSSGFI